MKEWVQNWNFGLPGRGSEVGKFCSEYVQGPLIYPLPNRLLLNRAAESDLVIWEEAMASSVSAARTLGLRIWCAAYMPAPWVMGPARQTRWLGQGDSETLGLVFPMMILTASDGVESEHVA